MKMRATPNHLLGTASALALAVTAIVGAAAPQPAAAAQGVYGGGSTLLSLSARQIFDCYHGVTLPSDGYSFSSSFPTPGALPTTCTVGALSTVEGLYAGVGSGSGLRGFIANDPHQLLQSPNIPTVPNIFPLPASAPVYVDGSGAAPFGLYPYPELDFAASDSPLPNFTVTTGSTLAAANSLTTVSYSSFTPTTNWQACAGHDHGNRRCQHDGHLQHGEIRPADPDPGRRSSGRHRRQRRHHHRGDMDDPLGSLAKHAGGRRHPALGGAALRDLLWRGARLEFGRLDRLPDEHRRRQLPVIRRR